MNMPRAPLSDRILILLGGVGLLLAAVLATVREIAPPWSDAQATVRAEVTRSMGEARAETLPTGVQQLWIEELDRVDRCTTCHACTDWGEAMAAAPQPATSHPHPDLLRAHPIERFGCTLCHGGQGPATERAAAHGEVHFWEEPLLGEVRAERYGISRAELMEMRCNACHQEQARVEGMPFLNEAKLLVAKLKCDRCHTFQGGGATRAPDLSREGEKHPSQFHFPDGWRGPRTALAWHVEHLLDPQAVTPNSEMPKHALTRRQATAIALLVMSWRRNTLPRAWVPERAR